MGSIEDSQSLQELVNQLSEVLKAGDYNKDNAVRQDALRLSSLLTTRLQDPHELAFEIACFGPAYGACCRAGVEIHLFEAIAENNGPISAKEIAVKTGSDHLLVVRLLRVITALGVVAEVGPELYQALPVTHAMTTSMVRATYKHFWDQGLASLLHLPSYLATQGHHCPTDARNGLFQYAYSTDMDAFSYWQAQPPPHQAIDNFNFLMTCLRGDEPFWLTWFPVHERIFEGALPDRAVFVDVGGGLGHDVAAFKRRYGRDLPNNGTLVLQDTPTVINDPEQLKVEDMITIAYDFFTPQVVKGARVYYYSHILHDWSDEACAEILRNVRSAMNREYSKLLLHEFIVPETRCSRNQAGFDIQMMGMHAGMERTKAQWTKLLEEEGFKIIKFWIPPGDMEGIVEAELNDAFVNA